MYETVEVITKNTKNNTIEVSCPRSICENCSGDMFCNIKGKTFEAFVPEEFENIKVGDKARLFLPPKRTISTTFITLMIPLLCFPLFYLIFPFLAPLVRFLMGLIGIGIGFAGVALYFKKTKLNYVPTVSYIYGKDEAFFEKEDTDIFLNGNK